MKVQRKTLVKWLLALVAVVLMAALATKGAVLARRWIPSLDPLPDHDEYTEVIAQVTSSVDKDQDGVDDQSDILNSAFAYIATKPQYKSAYYAGGYPDDGYGVCTDVVAFALKDSGYDLQALVDADINTDASAYGIDAPDPNIDFRRVSNLKIYFDHTALSLTTDTAQIEEWQGGDIVVYQDHIGIVSNKRNSKGVPYLIHHFRPNQQNYEEDALEAWAPIMGHYRISE